MFNLDIWKEKTGDSLKNVGGWLEQRRRQDAPLLLYGYLSTLTLTPLALAMSSGDAMAAGVALGGVLGGVGSGLIAGKVQQWAEAAGTLDEPALAAQISREAAADERLRAELDAVLDKLDVIQRAQAALPADQQPVFSQNLRTELRRLGNLPRFEAALSGEGVIVQGKKARGAFAKEGGTAIAGDVGSLTINQGRPATDPRSLREAYLNRLLETCSSLSLSGIDPKAASSQAEARLELSAVYTALLTLSSASLQEMERSRAAVQEERRLPALAQLNRHPRLVLLGDPGSGKSTFVDFVAMCLAGEQLQHPVVNLALLTGPLPDDEGRDQAERQPWQQGALLPVRVVLRDFAARGLPPVGETATGEHLWRFITGELKRSALGGFARPLSEELLERGGLLLLDGLDEVPEADQRRVQIKQAVTDFSRVFHRCRVLITSRTYAYQQQEWRLPGFEEAVLAPFSRGQILRFVEGWYRHIAALRGLNPEDAQGRAELLKRAIFSSHQLTGLAERPLLLTLMASLHAWRGGSLPEKREELYADTVDLLLDWWESPKVVRGAQGQVEVRQRSLAEWLKVDRAKVRTLLNGLAYQAHEKQPELTGTADVAEGELVTGLIHLSQNQDVNPVRLIEFLRDRAGLLLPRGVGVYTFPHRTFQEYLAACHLTDTDYPDKVATLARRDPNRWREVALLAGAKAARGTSSAIWQLADALCYQDVPGNGSGEEHWGALLAGQALVETANLQQVNERNQPKLARVRRWLAHIIEGDALPATERVAAGVSLAHLGDDRPGVGVRQSSPFPILGREAVSSPEGPGVRATLPDIAWCEVPGGPFIQGSKDNRQKFIGEETPQQEIDLPAFKISRYPITNAQFEAFVTDGGYSDQWRHCWTEAGWAWKGKRSGPDRYGGVFSLPNHPVVMVRWYEAIAFCGWLTERLRAAGELGEGQEITLPSESQWEKAARGRDGRVYPWGDKADPERANYDDTGIGSTSAVGCFAGGASEYGVQDMSGNVWEWCLTAFQESYEDYKDDNDKQGNTPRVLRGGAFHFNLQNVRCAVRHGSFPNLRNFDGGFRVVLSPFL
ncbi:MAG: SUMF1/EgtB/PvdO family nonheme iron enzyme [Anaerolineae bacterium]